MFIQRLITTLVLIPVALFMIYYSWSWFLGLLLLLIVAIASMEWSRLIPIHTMLYRLFFTVLMMGLTILSFYMLNTWSLVAVALWLMIFFAVLNYPSSMSWWGRPSIVFFAAVILLPLLGAGLSSVYLLPNGKDLMVYLFCLVWAADVGAYVTGKLWGRHKLIPSVSPGKTIEGFAGGYIAVILIALLASLYFQPTHLWMWFLMASLVAFVSVLGDLFFSMLKRRVLLKDTGQLFPGHGGALDRFDSLLAAMPVYFLLIGHIPLGR